MKFLVPFFLVFPFVLFSQNTNRQFVSSTELKDGIQITVSDGNYYFYSYNQKVIETTFEIKPKQEKGKLRVLMFDFSIKPKPTGVIISKNNNISVLKMNRSAGIIISNTKNTKIFKKYD